jgi:hypothetical protein
VLEKAVPNFRATVALDGEWQFVADPERLYAADSLPAGEPIQVPGCWESQVARPYRIITAWYRRTIDVPADWRGDRAILRFGAVMYRCAVYLNGRLIGEHEGGYTPFEVPLDEAVRFGEPNELAVRVVNPLNGLDEYPAFSVEEVLLAQSLEPDLPLSEAPHGKQTWYSSMSGIWLSVTMERRPHVAIGSLRVRPDLGASSAHVRWTIDGNVHDALDRGATLALELAIVDGDGDRVAEHRQDLRGDVASGDVELHIPSPRLWDIDQPNLYSVEGRLVGSAGGAEPVVRDALSARFGMREIATRDGKILLNGRPIYLLGALDQDFYPDTISTPPTREYLDEQIRLARELGINLLRCHIKAPDPRYLDAADEAGILVWCELPNWTRFTTASAARGRATLEAMVEAFGNHPSIVIWTIINEDWGTQLRYEARDRHWVRNTYSWLKRLDPTRLVVDNSACETPQTPNFHLRTDLADFHIYFVAPDNARRWRNMIDDFARRPVWLWSPHGDAEPQGDEPLVLSEFGSWGLPRLDRLIAHHGREPWWFSTGRHYYRPTGIKRRFTAYGLDRIWSTVDDLAEATQWHQFDGLQYEIAQMRRHDSVQGYVITELTDAYWEANGLLDPMRGRKAYHDRVGSFNAPDVVIADLERRDLCARESLAADVHLSSYGTPSSGGRITWDLEISDAHHLSGELPVTEWPQYTVRPVGRIEAQIPDVREVTDAYLTLRAFDAEGTQRAQDQIRLAVVPASSRQTDNPLELAVHDPLGIWNVGGRVEDLGHRLVREDQAQLIVASELTDSLVQAVENDGARVLILVRTRAAIPEQHDLARRVAVHLRRLPHSGWPGQRSPWEGDWVTSWSWILHDALPGLPLRNPLDFAYEEVLPDHVLLGYDPARHRDEVTAGMFVGWVHTPAAIVWTFRQGRGAVTLTTFRVAPEKGPVATLLLERLLQQAATADRRSVDRSGNGRAEQSAAAPSLVPPGARH